MIRKAAYQLAALASILLALAGVVLPVLPTTPFALLALWCATRSSPALARWLKQHRWLGPAIKAWQEHRAIPVSAKWLACIMLLISASVLALSGAPLWGLAAFSLFASGVAIFVVTRPSAPIPDRS